MFETQSVIQQLILIFDVVSTKIYKNKPMWCLNYSA